MSESSIWQDAARVLRGSEPYARLRDAVRAKQSIEIARLPIPAAAWTLGELSRDLDRPALVVVPHETAAWSWLEAIRCFLPDEQMVYFPAPSLTPYQEAEVSLLVRAEEARALHAVATGLARAIVTTPRALFRRLPSPSAVRAAGFELDAGDDVPIDDLISHLLQWGYHRSDLVFEVGQLAVRGGVFDVFPPGAERPLRFDFFGDTIESIRRFDAESQRSQGTVGRAELLPLSLFARGPKQAKELANLLARASGVQVGGGGAEGVSDDIAAKLAALRDRGGFDGWEHYLPLLQAETHTLWTYLDEPLTVALDPSGLLEEVERHRSALDADYEARQLSDRLAVPPGDLEHAADDVMAPVATAGVRLGDLFSPTGDAVDFGAQQTEILHDKLQLLPREIETVTGRGERAVLVAPEEHRQKLAEMLDVHEVPLGPSGMELASGDLQRGFRLPAAGLNVWGERQLLRRAPLVRRASKKRKFGPFLASIRDLKIGDYVVHSEHGIGQFLELRNLGGGPARADLPPAVAAAAPEQADEIEVMEIAYSGGKRLLLPLSRLDQIQKYSGIEGVAPRLDKLGGTSWKRTKSRIKKGMRDMAAELLKLYAERQMAKAPQIEGGSELQSTFEAAFAYDETADQLDAIQAIYDDLGRTQPMDRLLCGDVGFGKTEVAMRAALRAVEGGYQVVVLAPTTILADQHYERFIERFEGLPVTIEMISRFRTQPEVKKAVQDLEAGRLDIVIGTHRLIAKTIGYKKLGLVIIDEEQRFGVAHKERLKTLRKDVHVLAMSATPVPRTLQLSLAGVRDLSLIETPPRDRMAVETAILPFDPRLVREALEYELDRQGQVYYVYNRVETIDNFAAYLKEIYPGLKVAVGHGQLDEKELSKRMHAFTAGEYDVLLATTIIENGIDIPNVNTMIVHNAHRFGLAQLYQLRGRVGRSDQLAFCFLLVPGDQVLSQDARKRLDAIREFTELGAGFRVAGRDLEIRGAGNLLGAEQSGHIGAVGIETYLKMLEETVAELRGEAPPDEVSVQIDLPLQMSIPEEYVGDANLRMEIYHRLATGDEAEAALVDELKDRFGDPPESVLTLIRAAALKRMAEDLRLQAITARSGRLVLRLRQDSRVEPERLVALMHSGPGYHFSPAGALRVEGVRADEALDRARELLEHLTPPELVAGGSVGDAPSGSVGA
ncbi:MAG: transcription-repair coupling factor [Acidobacteriota bacterium]